MPSTTVLMRAKSLGEIIGRAGVNAFVFAEEEIGEPHMDSINQNQNQIIVFSTEK